MSAASLSERTRAHYADYSPAPNEWARLGALAKVDNLVRLAGDIARDRVLEIGCGEGALLARMDGLGFASELYGLEISERSVEAVRGRDLPTLAEVRCFDGARVPYPDDHFDLIVLSHVLEHVEHPRQLLYEAARVGRHVLVEVPLEDHWRLPRDYAPNAIGHINFFHARGMRRLLQSCELRVVGEHVATPSREAYAYQHGALGHLVWGCKEALLRVLPLLATRLSTYHGAFLCERPTR